MKKTKKILSCLLALALAFNFLLPMVVVAKEEEKLINVVLYEDEYNYITTQLPENLANDENYINKLKADNVAEILSQVNSESCCSMREDGNVVKPSFVTPEKPDTPDRKLLGPCKTWSLSSVKSQVGKSAWTKYVNTLTTSSAEAAFKALLKYLKKPLKGSLPFIFVGLVADFINNVESWWAETLYLLETKKIRYVKQCIYENLKGDYPKVFNIITRVK